MLMGLCHVEDRITNKENLSGSENFRHLLIFAFGKFFLVPEHVVLNCSINYLKKITVN